MYNNEQLVRIKERFETLYTLELQENVPDHAYLTMLEDEIHRVVTQIRMNDENQ